MSKTKAEKTLSPYYGKPYMQHDQWKGQSCAFACVSEIRESEDSYNYPGTSYFSVVVNYPEHFANDVIDVGSGSQNKSGVHSFSLLEGVSLTASIHFDRGYLKKSTDKLEKWLQNNPQYHTFLITGQTHLNTEMLQYLSEQMYNWLNSGKFMCEDGNSHNYGFHNAYFSKWIGEYCTFTCRFHSDISVTTISPLKTNPSMPMVISLPKYSSLSAQMCLTRGQVQSFIKKLQNCNNHSAPGVIFSLRVSMHFNRNMVQNFIARAQRWFKENS